LTRSLLAIASLVIITTSPASTAQAPPPFAIELLDSPAVLGTAQPRFTSLGDRVLLSWIESGGTRATVKVAERTTTGWSSPQTVVSGTNLVVNAADVPSVHALPGGLLVAQWLQENGLDPEAYDLRLSRSTDGGKTWSPPTSPHHDGTKTQHGFASLFPTGGGFGLVWLDGSKGPDMALRATMYGADGKQGTETQVDPRVCECCQTAAAVTTDGPVAVFRDRSAGEIRDVYVSRLLAGKWSPPAAVHQDGWKINGCPVNGPAISAAGREVAVSWFTVQANQGHTYLAFSRDAGRTFGPPIRVDDGSAIGRVQVELLTGSNAGSAAVSWIDSTEGSQLKVRKIDRSGVRGPAIKVADGMGAHYPRMAHRGGELLFAWAENTRGTTRVRTARAPLSQK
jgi:hypothetical protein